jgi:hypothetical protein
MHEEMQHLRLNLLAWPGKVFGQIATRKQSGRGDMREILPAHCKVRIEFVSMQVMHEQHHSEDVVFGCVRWIHAPVFGSQLAKFRDVSIL